MLEKMIRQTPALETNSMNLLIVIMKPGRSDMIHHTLLKCEYHLIPCSLEIQMSSVGNFLFGENHLTGHNKL